MPVPAWSYGKSVALDNLAGVTSTYIKAMEPKRKLQLAPMPESVRKSIAAFAHDLKQDGAVPEITALVMRAVADKAVVVENGKALDNFKVRP